MLHRIGFVSFVALIVGGASGAAESSWRIEPTSHLVRAGTGDIGRIAFFRSADGGDSGAVWLMNPDGREQRRLTREGDAEPGLDWSPDGRKIAFESFRGQGSQPSVWIMDSDGSDLHELHGSRRLSGPSWSPDGRTIALHGMWLVSVDGTRKTRLTRDGGWGPDWSRDGRVAFSREMRGDDDRTEEIFVIDANGRNERRLTRNSAYDSSPTWSPDGTRIAFQRGGYRYPGLIYVMDADGQNARRLARGTSPTWSPDGRKIAYDRNFTIWVMDAGGSAQHRISPSPGVPRLEFGTHAAPEWSAG